MNKGSKILDRFFSEKTGFYIIITGLIITLLSTVVFLYFGDWTFSKHLDEEKIGQFGDFIGGIVGCMVALVGVILYYVALKDQRKDIKINQETLKLQIEALNQQIIEFKEQKKELEATRMIYEQQNKTMKIQQFESNFYSFLDVYLKVKNELDEHSSGKDFFNEKYESMVENIRLSTDSYLDIHKNLMDTYTNIYIEDRGRFSRYFKTVYRLIKIIDSSTLEDQEKCFYSKIVRSQISDYELLILYYNYHSDFGNRVCSLILNYNLLKHISALSKIEFLKRYDIDLTKKNKLIVFTDWLSNLIYNNLINAYDLESDPIKISEEFKSYNIIVDLNIDTDISVQCSFRKDTDRAVFPFPDDEFKDFICHFLYDRLFYSQFSIPVGDEIQKSTTSTDDKIIFSYLVQSEKKILISNDKY